MNKWFLLFTAVFLTSSSCELFKPAPVDDSILVIDYQPFGEKYSRGKTKVKKLPELSTLRLEKNLPVLDGATALYPLYAAFVRAIYPEDDYYPYGTNQLVCVSGTSRAYNNLIDGKVDLIFCAKPSAEQIEKAKEKGITFQMTPIGREAFVFFVNNKNSVSGLNVEQIIGIYSGKIENWSELKGKNEEIKVYQRPKNSGSQTMLESIMGSNKIKPPLQEDVVNFMGGMITQTAGYRNYQNAIGYSFLFFSTQMVKNSQIKLLSINGVYPSAETIRADTYPYAEEFYAITAKNKNENVNKIIDWILSEQGQYLVNQTGYVSIR